MTDRGFHSGDIPVHRLTKLGNHLRPVSVQSHDVCRLGRKSIIYKHFPASSLIKHSYLDAIAKRCFTICQNYIHILDESTFSDDIVGNIVLYILYAAVVADNHIMKGDMIKSRMLHHASRKFKLLVECTYLHISGKSCRPHMVSGEILGNFNFIPICRSTHLSLELLDFLLIQLSEILHIFFLI